MSRYDQPPPAGKLHCLDLGKGRPLVLLHGIGMSVAAWSPVLDALAAQRRVLAFDLPGFGRSPPLAAGTVPTVAVLAASVAAALSAKGLDQPVDIAGSSLGGTIALELAASGRARSVVGISPATLWRKRGPRHVRTMFWLMRNAADRLPYLTERLLSWAPTRTLLLAAPVCAKGWQMPAEVAVAAATEFAASEVFDTTYDAALLEPFLKGPAITVPCTVAFGTRDGVLTPGAQRRERLPVHTRWLKPRGWGHVPMWDDPEGVAKLILSATV